MLPMRERGLKATGCNNRIRAVNAFLKWSGSQLKVPQLKEPVLVLPTFTAQQIRLLVTWEPKGRCQRRPHPHHAVARQPLQNHGGYDGAGQ